MSFSYFPHTEEDIQAMLARIGMKSLDDLYADIPKEVFFSDDKEYAAMGSEVEVRIRKKTFKGTICKRRFYEAKYKK